MDITVGFRGLTCSECGIRYYFPEDWCERAAEKKRGWNCPNGHRQIFGDSELAKVRRERDRLKQETARLEDEAAFYLECAQSQERRASAYKGHLTRVKSRAKAGLCPCCNRQFSDLIEHMKCRHPDFKPDAPIPEDDKVVKLPKRRRRS